MIYRDKIKPKRPPNRTFNSKTMLAENEERLNVIFDKTSMEFNVIQKVRLANAARSAASILKIAYKSAQNDFEDDLARVALWYGAPIYDVRKIIRYGVEQLHATMTDPKQFITFYGKAKIEYDSSFDGSGTTMSSAALARARSVDDHDSFTTDEQSLIERHGSMYKRENRIATQKGLKHMCESSTQFGGDFALPPAPCTPPKLAFDVGMAATRFCAPPDVHLFEYAAGGCPIYIEHEALASSVELVELRQIIYHQLAHRLLGVKDPNARVGIGTKPLLKTNCMRNAVIDPEVTLTDGGNLECFITSFDKPVSQSDRKRAYAMWPRDMRKHEKKKSKWQLNLTPITVNSPCGEDVIENTIVSPPGDPMNCSPWNPKDENPGEPMDMKDDYFGEQAPEKTARDFAPRMHIPNKSLLGHLKSKLFGR